MTSKTRGRKLLTVPQTAEQMCVGERFVRRLIAERRITFVRLGRHIRIPADAVDAYISSGTIAPRSTRRRAA
ncbi:excisionase family DNA-binding protein [Embleya sp. NPDC050154]|uniref:excisionase family DNA-binding protein n=1 Tax=Embleya sp. NPDC050154 TaxID=3363988 RepID=UPI0037A1DF76